MLRPDRVGVVTYFSAVTFYVAHFQAPLRMTRALKTPKSGTKVRDSGNDAHTLTLQRLKSHNFIFSKLLPQLQTV